MEVDSYKPIRELLARVRARWRMLRIFEATKRAALGASAVLLVAVVISQWAAPWMSRSPLVPAALGLLSLLLALGAVAWGFVPLRHGPSESRLARFIEEHVPSLDDRLVTAVDLIGGPDQSDNPAEAGSHGRSSLTEPMIANAATAARDVDVDTIVPADTLRRSGFRAAGAALLLAAVVVVAIGPAREARDAASLIFFPARVEIEVRPGNARVKAGMPLAVEARLVGNRAPVTAHVEIADGGQWRTVDMTRDPDGRFHLALESITAPFTYRVAAGTLTSATFTVTVARVPRVTRVDLEYTYPPTLGLKPRSEQDSGDIFAPSGTDVRVRIHTDRDVSSGRLALSDGKTLPLSSDTPTSLSVTVKIVADNSYRVMLADREGLTNPGDTEYFIRMLEDRPPEVHITRPAGDRGVTPLEEVDIAAQADDDYGIDRLDLVYAVRGGAEKTVALSVPPRATTVSARHTLYLEDLDVQPGDFVSYYVRARDVTRGKRSNETRSDIFFLEVQPFEQEFVLAQSQSMAGSGYSGTIDELVNAQRQVIVATWKLDRRAEDAAGARSAQDIRSVGRTESDLKARVEQTASSFRESAMRDPQRRPPGSGSTAANRTRPEEDAMTVAAEAMGNAVTALSALKTGEALSPEMRALNALLKAQADIKRRQLSLDQSASGAAGNNNRNYDISTLFDRELRQQQKTSYETPKAADKPQPSGSDALDKIKGLARRQDELLRRQKELTGAPMSPADRAREIEKLTREQSELRQRAEELARESSGRSGQQDQSARGGAQSESRKTLREISEEMRQAAGDIRRGSPEGAESSGGRALEKLRDLERRMVDRRRPLGDMQLEARQLADAERQIASELSKLGPGDARTDVMRRLAGEEQRLAERARALQAGLQQQSGADLSREKTADQKAQAAVGDAARELGRLSDRMRQSADQMRGASGGPGADKNEQEASGERDIARQLDRLADRLAGASGKDDESRKLSEQLARTQQLREKLDQVNRDLENAGKQNGRTTAAASNQKAAGERGRTGAGRQGAGGTDLSELREELLRQLRDTRNLLDDLQRQDPGFSRNGAGFTFEGQGMIFSAPGTEAFKQDFAKWETLRRQADAALEQAESTLSKKLQARNAKDRLAAGLDDRAPAEYQKQVDSYFKAIAAGKKQ